ncbi:MULTISPECIES: hypothetical protein [unclassified Ruegeria]|uniref:hypothetical protein n=1 Tax=unclassified Ruegeria TaxID=2625375 RepID=UPI0014883068|nr:MULTISPECIES: hypothetical protein [unclassified Ruegeria]
MTESVKKQICRSTVRRFLVAAIDNPCQKTPLINETWQKYEIAAVSGQRTIEVGNLDKGAGVMHQPIEVSVGCIQEVAVGQRGWQR